MKSKLFGLVGLLIITLSLMFSPVALAEMDSGSVTIGVNTTEAPLPSSDGADQVAENMPEASSTEMADWLLAKTQIGGKEINRAVMIAVPLLTILVGVTGYFVVKKALKRHELAKYTRMDAYQRKQRAWAKYAWSHADEPNTEVININQLARQHQARKMAGKLAPSALIPILVVITYLVLPNSFAATYLVLDVSDPNFNITVAPESMEYDVDVVKLKSVTTTVTTNAPNGYRLLVGGSSLPAGVIVKIYNAQGSALEVTEEFQILKIATAATPTEVDQWTIELTIPAGTPVEEYRGSVEFRAVVDDFPE